MDLSPTEYRSLAEFRFRIRKFLHFSEEQSRALGLEILMVRQVMRTNLVALPAGSSLDDARLLLNSANASPHGQLLYPVVDKAKNLCGVITRKHLAKLLDDSNPSGTRLQDLVRPDPVVAHPDEPLRAVVYRMAETGFMRLPVVERTDERKLVGIVALRIC